MIDSIFERSSFRNFRIIVLDNGKLPTETRARFERLGVRVAFYSFTGPFNFPDKMNHAFSLVETEDVIALNDDVEVISPDWIEALLAYSRRPDIGVVGARLLYPNSCIQHAGVVTGVNGPTTHIFHNMPSDQIGYCGFTHVVRNYSAVTGAVMATRMSIVHEFKGFDRAMTIDYNDMDFCLRIREAGYRIVYTPHATLYHFEGSTQRRREPTASDQTFFLTRWGNAIKSDPYYNSNLPHDRVDCIVHRW